MSGPDNCADDFQPGSVLPALVEALMGGTPGLSAALREVAMTVQLLCAMGASKSDASAQEWRERFLAMLENSDVQVKFVKCASREDALATMAALAGGSGSKH